MRVIAGIYGGRELVAPRGRATRPTSDRVREALFSILGDVSGARVLDLFAGSGALAIEALSRGAAEATLVDSSAAAVAAIRRNLDAAGDRGERPPREGLAFLERARGSGASIRSRLPRSPIPPRELAVGGALGGAGAGARRRGPRRRRERSPQSARARARAARRAPLRRHPDPDPWLPITASRSAPARSTRSPTGIST